jgi:hypothetical protein
VKTPARHALTIALVATALCVDRAVANAPALRPQVAEAAGRLVSRLSIRLCRVMPALRVVETRNHGSIEPLASATLRPSFTTGHDVRLLPLLLRLPPPQN